MSHGPTRRAHTVAAVEAKRVAVEAIVAVVVVAVATAAAVVVTAAAVVVVVTAEAAEGTAGGKAEESGVRSKYQRRGGAHLDNRACATFFSSSWLSKVMAEMGRRGGKIGGKRRMETMTPEEHRNFASNAAKKRWAETNGNRDVKRAG